MLFGNNSLNRRHFLKCMGGVGLLGGIGVPAFVSAVSDSIKRRIPSSDEWLPVIGMGSWITFDVGDFAKARARRVEVLKTFFERGGALVDSSPMYGSSEEVIGHCLDKLTNDQGLFSATKVWIPGQWMGIRQMEASRELWGVEQFDLMQIHNMLDWDAHIETLKAWKAEGRIRYMGITTSHGRRHRELLEVMQREPFDFVQFTYNVADREAERELLPLAADKGIAVIINRPFQRGGLFRHVKGKQLPPFAHEIGCDNWAQFFLKFIVSHPAVTCAIPATSRVDHMQENMGAMYGALPDAVMRQRMIDYFESI